METTEKSKRDPSSRRLDFACGRQTRSDRVRSARKGTIGGWVVAAKRRQAVGLDKRGNREGGVMPPLQEKGKKAARGVNDEGQTCRGGKGVAAQEKRDPSRCSG